MEINKAIGLRIKTRRNQLGLSKTQLAGLISDSFTSSRDSTSHKKRTYQSIADWEMGKSFPNTLNFKILCDVLAITPNDLYGITNKTTRTDIINAQIELRDLFRYNNQLTFDGLPISEDIRMGLLQNIQTTLAMLGFSKKI